MPRPDYGYDAPYALLMFALVAAGCGIAAIVFLLLRQNHNALVMAVYFAFFFASASSFFYTTRRGKFLEWKKKLDGLHLRGDESALDMGCGRGAVLTAVARRLSSGRVTGIDIWSAMDQSGNARDVTLRNAALEGVSGRVQIETGDMRKLPLPDSSFDLVVSSLAIHNISSKADRELAVREGFRVLKPGGHIVRADIRATRLYERTLREVGAENVVRRRLGWRFWWGNPVAATCLVTALKPNR
jgi:arsenite methyltransferase